MKSLFIILFFLSQGRPGFATLRPSVWRIIDNEAFQPNTSHQPEVIPATRSHRKLRRSGDSTLYNNKVGFGSSAYIANVDIISRKFVARNKLLPFDVLAIVELKLVCMGDDMHVSCKYIQYFFNIARRLNSFPFNQ